MRATRFGNILGLKVIAMLFLAFLHLVQKSPSPCYFAWQIIFILSVIVIVILISIVFNTHINIHYTYVYFQKPVYVLQLYKLLSQTINFAKNYGYARVLSSFRSEACFFSVPYPVICATLFNPFMVE